MMPRVLFGIALVLVVLGGAAFLFAIPAHSHYLWTLGLSMMTCAVFLGVPFFLINGKGRDRLLTGASVAFAGLLAVWFAVWTLYRPPLWVAIATMVFVACAAGLGYAWWRSEQQNRASD